MNNTSVNEQPIIQNWFYVMGDSIIIYVNINGYDKCMLISSYFETGVKLDCDPINAQLNKHAIITSIRRFDVIITCLLRFVFAGNDLQQALLDWRYRTWNLVYIVHQIFQPLYVCDINMFRWYAANFIGQFTVRKYDDDIKWKYFCAFLALCAGNSPVIGEFLTQRPVMRSFDVTFDLRMNKRLSKQS